eukprot:scaffold242725_cov35-Tisochrysis_lutea.AAC.3
MALPTPDRRTALQSAALAGVAFSAPDAVRAAAAATDTWKAVDLPIATESPILFDIEFDPANPKNGFIVGNKGTFLQTTDGGNTWQAKSFANLDPEEEINYRFTKMSFLDGEVSAIMDTPCFPQASRPTVLSCRVVFPFMVQSILCEWATPMPGPASTLLRLEIPKCNVTAPVTPMARSDCRVGSSASLPFCCTLATPAPHGSVYLSRPNFLATLTTLSR